MVKDDVTLPPVQKLHYLKASLTDEPAQLLGNMSITGDNFERAWATLMQRYDNERALIIAYLGKLFGLESVTKELVSGLCSLLNDTCEVIGWLKSMNRPTKHWDNILVYMRVNRLGRFSRKAREEKTGSLHINPLFETLKTFLVSRLSTLEILKFAEGSQFKYSSTESRGKMTGVESGNKGSNTQAHGASLKEGGCPLCTGKNFVLFCPLFRPKNSNQRRELIRKCGLRFNCLGKHLIRNCISSKRCQTCSGQHHTMLHRRSSDAPLCESVNTAVPSTSNLNVTSTAFTPILSAVNSHLAQGPL
ncbi:uncharacterized protein LOC117177819 [Belonocnema kinseyi]|uniref:uncharacterized protein LOC117177819 n=1 Tax=Belonocnema kinseyi TaxID=2817044 RepID=UPI00143DDBD0|nr:uncharacterized protein LOC117177819 [Belonocnema kinseyi]